MEIILAWFSVGLGVAGLAYGIYQNRLKERVERLATLQAWEVYQSAYQALGWLVNALNEPDPAKRENILGQARARSDSHYSKTIHNLYTHHDKVTPELVDKWVSEGRIEEHAKRDFLRQLGEKYNA
ncbi:MAG: hypothetical protein P9E88_01360 [Candidatus Competibacter sp.]|jgi:hypothetical protein|nr:hypothetical protein [Candidatus Competibacter sp.]